ncbi:DUF3987 domain-containing protein [Paraburkholderia sp. CNPSo 3076]|uniref:DUF3987 domain-containing protein n=1 Tax=Paraburkholderia sp. CNPSo 3076 TaxID=2940936 RepID=UPI0022558B0C|nr:DUF3987 domain-containing protein [Paraburkholderia sp. CNPSo 3076]MCX5541501.1 DUF3987 domain-containing protein [Paraburkholderia sp. CNPSo 3076]
MPIVEFERSPALYQFSNTQGLYPADALPDLIRNAVFEVSANLRVPVELAAHAALASVSLACQNFIDVQCPSFPPAPCSLFLLTVSNSSGGKSLMEQRFLRAIKAFERKCEEDAAARMPDFRAELKIWSDDQRRLSKEYRDAKPGTEESRVIREQRLAHEKTQPVKPSARELRFAEISPQGLREALIANGAVAILSPEGAPALTGMTFSEPAMLSGYWSGEDRPVGLVSGNRRAANPRLSVSVMVQDDQFQGYMKSRGEDAFGTGLVARMLPAFPKSIVWPGQQTLTEDVPEPALDLFNERIAAILAQAVPAPDARPVRQLSEGARYYWKLFKETVHNQLICGTFSENIKSFFRKLGEQAARLAGLFHHFSGETGDVSPEAMKAAITLCEWYAYEFERVFSSFAPSQLQIQNEAAEKLFAWLQQAAANPMRYSKIKVGQYSERDLNNYSSIRNDPEKLAMAINVLEQQQRIATTYGKKGGRIVFYPPWMMRQFAQASFFSPQMNQVTVNPQSHAPAPLVVNQNLAKLDATDNRHHQHVQAQGVRLDDVLNRGDLLASKIRMFME